MYSCKSLYERRVGWESTFIFCNTEQNYRASVSLHLQIVFVGLAAVKRQHALAEICSLYMSDACL